MSNELCNELSSLFYDYDNNGAYQIESKKQAKLRGIWSPNIADALGLSEYFSSWAHRLFLTKDKIAEKVKREKERQRRRESMEGSSGDSQEWMAQ